MEKPRAAQGPFGPGQIAEAMIADPKLWRKIRITAPNECWVWTSTTRKGYGIHPVGRSRYGRAHRLVYVQIFGPIPEGLSVRHKCDNPPCCNPRHLEIGTHAENMCDAVVRGRMCRGERKPSAKLTQSQVLAIRASDEPSKVLARRFGVSPCNVTNIRAGRSWAWLGDLQ